jgi:hypothetical protein
MKIGIIGNMNNAYFALCRYLRDAGFNCELLIFKNEPEHFHPSCDTSSDDYKNYCRIVNWGEPANFLSDDFIQIKKDLDQYDFLIGNGPAPAYAAKAGRKLDIFMPYGYDLYSLPFYKLVHPRRIPAYLKTTYYQRKGIKEADYIFLDRTNKRFENTFHKLPFEGKRIVSPTPMVYHKEYEYLSSPNYKIKNQQLLDLRANNDLLIVQNVRQVWKRLPDYWSHKGNNKLIEGYHAFVEENPSTRSTLILFEYGIDVPHTKKLIRQLGIESSVVWMPKMIRKNLMEILFTADLIIGELEHSWLSYGVLLEALSLGKPIMHYRNEQDFKGDYPMLYPILNAHSSDDVLSGLNYLLHHPDKVKQIGIEGKEWFLEHCVNRTINYVLQAIEEKQAQVLYA